MAETPLTTTGHAWREGRCVRCGVQEPRAWAESCHEPGLSATLSLALRQAARAHLGLSDGDYWPSEIAAAQASSLLDSGWRVTPPHAPTRPDPADDRADLDVVRREAAAEALRDAADAALTMYDPPVEECINWSEWLRARADVLGGDA